MSVTIAPNFTSIVHPRQLEAMAELARRAPEGAFAEIGVFRGGSAEVLYRIALQQDRELHLFDTFTGTPNHVAGLDKHQVDAEFDAPGIEDKIRRLMPAAKLHVGIYPLTHPKVMPTLAFIHVDCDQYLGYKAVITKMWPLVCPGGIMLFDDYPYLGGAKQAVEEHFDPKSLFTCFQRYGVKKAYV
jgi:O-methyltransferase